MVPNGWYGTSANSESQKMVAEYIKIYGGTPSDINADVAEGYSVGQVAQQAVEHLKSLDNAKIISLPAQRRYPADRAGTGQIRLARPQRRGDDVHIPMAERQVRPGSPGGHVRFGGDPEPQADLEVGPPQKGHRMQVHGAAHGGDRVGQ